MITLYSYPPMFGLPDNNPFGLKVDTFLRLTQIEYSLKHLSLIQKTPHGVNCLILSMRVWWLVTVI